MRIGFILALSLLFFSCGNDRISENMRWWRGLSPEWQRTLLEALPSRGREPAAGWSSRRLLRGEEFTDVDSAALVDSILVLRELELNIELVESLRPLRALTRLESLVLSGSNEQIVDVAVLESLTALRQLQISSNDALVDLRPLSKLRNLRGLKFWDCKKLADLSPLASLDSLETLSIELFTLTRDRELHPAPSISDFSPVSKLKNLKKLDVKGYDLQNIDFVQPLQRLESLDISTNNLADLRPLAHLPELRQLFAHDNQIQSIEPLRHATKLEFLALTFNQVESLEPLRTATAIQDLYLINNRIADLSPLQTLVNLREINVSGNKVSDVSPLAGLPKLRAVHLNNNPLRTAAPLRNLPKLARLEMQETDVHSFDWLPTCAEKGSRWEFSADPPSDPAQQSILRQRFYTCEVDSSEADSPNKYQVCTCTCP